MTLTASLASQTLPVNSYGVSEIQFSQTSTSPPVARITLNVSQDSPDWQATFSRSGGLVLWPRRGITAVDRGSSFGSRSRTRLTRSAPSKATIESVELADNNTQLLIRADRGLNARGNWNPRTREYEIKIPNAQLSEGFRNPQLGSKRPISQLRIQQQDSQTVAILVQPAVGIRVEQLEQLSNQLLALQLQPLGAAAAPSRLSRSPQRPIAVPPPERSSPLPSQRISISRSNPLPRVPRGRILVVIDPGHGGKDPGAIGIGRMYEKHVVLPIAQQVAQILERQGIQVKMTRSGDYFISLQGRVQMANRAGANLFVSIHANSVGMRRPDVNGLETYYYQSGRGLADTIHRNILRRVNIRDRRVRRARFYVLRKSSMPAVLVETGFVTGREDAPKLANPNYRRQMAEAIASGILEYIKRNRR